MRQPIKRILHDTSTKCFGKVYTGVVVKHDQERVLQEKVYAGIVIDGMNSLYRA